MLDSFPDVVGTAALDAGGEVVVDRAAAVRSIHSAGRQHAVHRTILIVDVEGFGHPQRTNRDQVTVRVGVYRALEAAFEAAGIPWEGCDIEDRGDGVFVLAGADVPKATFVDALPRALATALRRHNSTHLDTERIRLRMALHAGEITYDDFGVTAKSINLAFRLLDAPPLKAALADSPGVLALIVSSWFYNEVVRHSDVEDAATYRRTRVTCRPGSACPTAPTRPRRRRWPLGFPGCRRGRGRSPGGAASWPR